MATITLQVSGIDEIRDLQINVEQFTPKFEDRLLENLGKAGKRAMEIRVPKGARPTGLQHDVLHFRADRHTEIVMFASPHNREVAMYNEMGVRPHYVSVRTSPELQQWIRLKIPSFKGNRLLIGGPNSRIKAGASHNRFTDISLQDVINDIPAIVEKTFNEINKVN